jgi:hypothetical protein
MPVKDTPKQAENRLKQAKNMPEPAPESGYFYALK